MPSTSFASDAPGLIVALPAEASSIGLARARVGSCVRWRHGWLAVSGMGPGNATRAAERALDHGATRLANWGVAGALDPSLVPGDVLVPERVRSADDDGGFTPDPEACARLIRVICDRCRLGRGTLWSSPQPVATRAEKHALAVRSGALAVDMEAAAIAAVARRAGVPFTVLKVICDPAGRELPPGLARAIGAGDGGVSMRMLAAVAGGGPATWRALGALARDFASARRALATVAAIAA